LAESLSIWPVVVPLFTLVVGYLLNILKGVFDFSRETKKESIQKRERVYEEIFVRLFTVFKRYKMAVIRCGLRSSPTGDHQEWDLSKDIEEAVGTDFSDLETLLYSKSLLIDADVFEELLRIPGMFGLRRREFEELQTRGIMMNIARFEIDHADLLWKYTLKVMNKVRRDIGLNRYPESLLSFWEKTMTVTDALSLTDGE
jgi:hypothetical protein